MRYVLFPFLMACGGADPVNIPDGGGGGDSASDAVAVPDVDPGTCTGSCIPPVPMGWNVTAYDPANRSALCPMAYNSATDTIEAPMAAAAVCTCAGMVKSQPTCDVQSASLNLSGNPQCGN